MVVLKFVPITLNCESVFEASKIKILATMATLPLRSSGRFN
jgi:hypothetical protein